MRETHRGNQYVPGTYWAECDECGFDFLRTQLVKRYDGGTVCGKCWEPRHPQDMVRATPRERPFRRD